MIDATVTSTELPSDALGGEDPFVAEVRATRATLARDAGYDLGRIVTDLRRIELEESAHGRTILATGSPAPGAAS